MSLGALLLNLVLIIVLIWFLALILSGIFKALLLIAFVVAISWFIAGIGLNRDN